MFLRDIKNPTNLLLKNNNLGVCFPSDPVPSRPPRTGNDCVTDGDRRAGGALFPDKKNLNHNKARTRGGGGGGDGDSDGRTDGRWAGRMSVVHVTVFIEGNQLLRTRTQGTDAFKMYGK